MAVATPNNAAQKAQAAAQAAASRDAANLAFLRTSGKQYAICPPSGGAGINQNYVTGQTLMFDVPTGNGAYLDELLVQVNLTLNMATGTAAVYGLTASSVWALIDHIVIQYGNTVATFRPVILRTLAILQGYERAFPEQINGGQTVANVSNSVWGTFGVGTGANTWKFWFRVPLRWIPRSPAGMLPTMGDSTKAQVQIVCASAIMGNDPLLNACYAVSGTGNAVTVTSGTVAVEAISRNGQNLVSTRNMLMDLQGVPTIQWTTESQLSPLTSGTMLHKKFDSKLQHLYAISYVIDGQQATKYAAETNIAGIELTQDSNAQNKFWSFGVNGNNVGTTEYFEQFRNHLGQDIDEGVIPWVPGPSFLGLNPDNLEGNSFLNMIPGQGGWPDANYGIQVTNVASPLAGVQPRVETYLVSVNPLGLQRA